MILLKGLHSTCQQLWKTQQWSQDWKRSVFIPISKNGGAKECSNYHTIALISHASKIMLKILQTKVSALCELRMSICANWIQKKQRNQRSNCHLLDHRKSKIIKTICFIDYIKTFDYVNHNKLWKILQVVGIPNHHLTCLLKNLYAGQEATVRTRHGTKDLFKIGKGVCQDFIVLPCLLNLYINHVKCQAGWRTSWNQDCHKKHQQYQVCRWYHFNDRKGRVTKESLDEDERREWKNLA